MAETIVSVIAEKLLSKLISFTSNQVSLAWGVKNDVQELVDTLNIIKAVLLDAEEKQIHNQNLRVWLGKLKEVCYDVEDILDDVEVEDLRKQVVNHQSITRKVRHFFSSSNPVAFHFILGHKIKEIKKRLAKIIADKNNFTLFEKIGSNHVISWERETHSFVHGSDVIGRDKDKEMIIDFLLRPSDGHENLSVIPIVGIGGLGKTTLARFVYNDKRVSDHFELKMWVCVSDEFFLKKLLIDIINSAIEEKYIQKNIDQLQTILRDNIRDKKYLLVLDDVWNENFELWCDLRNLLTECVSGSKIIVTTRSDRVASIMGTTSTYKLEGLALGQCWSVFVKYAFKEGQEKQHPNLIKIGKEIVTKCRGVPLAVRALGSLLYSSTYEQDWINVRDNEIWKLDQKDNNILHALKISYNHLSPPLKQCFVYCSIFPKDFQFYSHDLINFWMAHGLLQAHNENEDLANIGMQYIKELMWRSFFQDIKDLRNGVYSFKIHDLMHDVATSLFQNESLIVKGSNQIIAKTSYRHLLFPHFDASQVEAPSFLANLGNLRSIMFSTYVGENITISQSFLELIVSRFQFLRILYLSNLGIEVVPKRIDNLKHLRYLDLSCNQKIKKLSRSIYKLQSLQFLSLYNCEKLKELSGDVKYLTSLRVLILTTTQKHLPNNGIGCLNSLRFLIIYNCSKLEYLCEDIGRLRVIRRLCISKCPSLISLPRGVRSLSSLEDLRLIDCERLNLDLSIGSDEQHNHEELNSTGPPLRFLLINNLPQLVQLPQRLLRCSTNTLQTLLISNCSKLKALPESMQKLQALGVWNCPELSSLPKDINHLIALRELIIEDCPKLTETCKPEAAEDWPKIVHIPKIKLDGEIIKSTEN
ncbi:putative disease resistance protein RGA1 isoform X1 [Mangifera indica]|uniref:putative disease resistance protein RGA1 isoform X1 n=1 Tax=Mangifera indica TaxID=29780 RepID=UPI001CFB6BC0|nr:putative disease resistance protein RGA1 isoform X1 [Mangifera indica]XP_044508296.1 putative disease resistance protein RGA1 isoform X1 [Mangifera indica]XP_044508297.1 putative disease resistance protein RGA1 isoform X1 [Mangifera indica]XP_044508298.1 putative disease resistance protein RGA1 isoform X1 [Mangifera indica]XP_044508299.1 putative disease resistance protein RGA1 isoform X1 [Mangifera indica]XP_044508300.1 putative disease resistance protein RGA1 isoform X1 [Mangifera indica]